MWGKPTTAAANPAPQQPPLSVADLRARLTDRVRAREMLRTQQASFAYDSASGRDGAPDRLARAKQQLRQLDDEITDLSDVIAVAEIRDEARRQARIVELKAKAHAVLAKLDEDAGVVAQRYRADQASVAEMHGPFRGRYAFGWAMRDLTGDASFLRGWQMPLREEDERMAGTLRGVPVEMPASELIRELKELLQKK